MNDGVLAVKIKCQEILEDLKTYYPGQLKYNGTMKMIYKQFELALVKVDQRKTLDVHFVSSCVRMFVDDTADYMHPLVGKMEKTAELIELYNKRVRGGNNE
ncbi:hypothetical protein [Alkalihalophilus marmarensis]|uniref:Uncharacterized protein n=1 Tax=Alkalihalophilus marmarensis DSM 21297 TaxID=1188261 RepID=U6SLS8_9BACI|nr:hypothetical protein [Alkalihalophilus marmarensis]ERN51845.1 hypothetical protein A33I_18715 [Alkalihalophilus marmarensis DSM 21297]